MNDQTPTTTTEPSAQGALERDNAELREEVIRSRSQLNKMKKALGDERIKSTRLERQLAGQDEDLHDPTKQRGIGGIPLGDHPVLLEAERIERALGMAPTLDQQLRSLGVAPADQLLHLTEGQPPIDPTDFTRWGHALDNRTERWQGIHLTREAAIEEGRQRHGGSGFWIARGVQCDPAEFMPNVGEVLDIMTTNAIDNVGEVAEEWPDFVAEVGRAELTEILAAWARKHAPCEFWNADGHEEEMPHVADATGVEDADDA